MSAPAIAFMVAFTAAVLVTLLTPCCSIVAQKVGSLL